MPKRPIEDDDDDLNSDLRSQNSYSSYTGSQGSATTMNSAVVRMGDMGVNGLLWSTSLPYVFGNLAEALAYINQYQIIFYIAGVSGSNSLALYWPLCNIVYLMPQLGFAEAAADYVTACMARNHIHTARSYFNSWLAITLLWGVLVTIVFGVSATKMLSVLDCDNGLIYGHTWSQIVFVIMPLANILSGAVYPFLDAENRVMLGLMRQLVFAAVYIIFDQLFFFTALHQSAPEVLKGTSSLSQQMASELIMFDSLGLCFTSLILTAWFILIFLRKQVLDMPVKGNMHFSWKELWPLRPKVLARLSKRGVQMYLEKLSQPLLIFVGNFLIGSSYTDPYEIYSSRAALLLYQRMYDLLSAIPQGFQRGFNTVISYNLGMRYYNRVKSLLIASSLWQCVISAVFCLLVFIFYNMVFSFVHARSMNEDEAVRFFRTSGASAIQLAAVTPAFMGFYTTVQSLLMAEGRGWMALALTLARFVTGVITVLLSFYIIGDGSNLIVALPLADLLAIIIGIAFLVYYVYKYNHLANVEEARKAKAEFERQLTEMDVPDMDGNAADEDEEGYKGGGAGGEGVRAED